MSTLEVNKLAPLADNGTVTLGDSGDTITIPTGAGLTVTDEVKTNKISPASGTAFTLGDSGDTFTIPSGATITNSGTATGFGGNNTPSFMAIKTPNQSVSANTSTIVTFNSEIFDSDGKYDTSTSKFTPTVAGKYFLFAQINIQAVHDQATTEFDFKKNGSNVMGRYKHIALNSSSDREPSLHSSIIVDADADDYFQIVTFTDFGSGTTITGDNAGFTYFGGYKIIGA
jgi:hypothetical protein